MRLLHTNFKKAGFSILILIVVGTIVALAAGFVPQLLHLTPYVKLAGLIGMFFIIFSQEKEETEVVKKRRVTGIIFAFTAIFAYAIIDIVFHQLFHTNRQSVSELLLYGFLTYCFWFYLGKHIYRGR